MAVWQVNFYVVPNGALATAARPVTSAALASTDWWAVTAFPSDYRTRLSAIASAAQPDRTDVESWGEQEGNRIDVLSRDGRVNSVMVHVDVRRLDARFGAALLGFVRAASAVLVRQDGSVVEPTINAYAGALRSSAAWRYASDPAAWLAARMASDDDL